MQFIVASVACVRTLVDCLLGPGGLVSGAITAGTTLVIAGRAPGVLRFVCRYWGGSTKIGKMIGASCLIVVGVFITPLPFFGSIFRVLLIPCFGRFMWPFAVAGLGFKYFTTSS